MKTNSSRQTALTQLAKKRDRQRRLLLQRRSHSIETLEPREMMAVLGDTEKKALKEAFQSLTGFTTNLEQSELLNTIIPIIDKKVGEVVDIDQLLKERFLAPVEKFLDSAQPTVEDLQKLFQSGLSGVANAALGKMPNLPQLVPNISFAASFDVDIAKNFQFEYDLGQQLKAAGVDANIGKLTTDLNFELHFGAGIEIDLSKVGGAPSDIVKFTLKDGTKTDGSRIVAKATTTLSNFDVSVGVAGASVTNGNLVLDVALPMDFGGAADKFAFSLESLKTTATSVANVFSFKTNAEANKSLKLSLPLTVEIGGTKVVDNKALIVKDDDLFDRKFDLMKTGPVDSDPNVYLVIPPELKDFRAMGAAAIFGIVQKLGDYFGDISQSEVFQTEIPFTDGKKLGEIVNLREAFEAKVVNKARESAKNTAGQVVDAAKQVADDARNYAFKNVQDLASRIGNKIGYKNDDYNADGKNDPRLEFDVDFSHVVKLPDMALNFNVDLGELAKFGIEKSNLGVSAQIDAQFDFLVLLQLPGSEDADKIADDQPDGTLVLRRDKLVSSLNNGGDLLTGAGKDFKVTLSDGTTFDVELDNPIIPITSAVKAKVSENEQGDLTNQITFSGTPNLANVQTGHILSIMNRTDGKERTDRFTITAIDRTTSTLTVSPTPTAGAGEFDWAVDQPPVDLGQIIDRINTGGAAAAAKFELTANAERTGFRIVDKTAVGTAATGASKLKIEVLGGSRAAVALGIAGTGSAPKDGDPVAIEGAPLHGKTLLDNVFLRNFQIDAGANLSASIEKATASLGIVGINVTNATGVARAGVGLALHDPGPTFDGRVTLAEAGKAVREVATKLTAQKPVAFPVKPNGTLTVNIQGKDNEFKIDVGQATDAAALTAKINAAPGFSDLAEAKVNGNEISIELKLAGLTTLQRGARRLTVNQSAALGLTRNEVHHEKVAFIPTFPIPAGTNLNLSIAQDDVPNPVVIAFDGAVEFADLKSLTASISKKLEGKPISVGSTGAKLTFSLNNGRARSVDIPNALPALGFTAPLKAYLVRPGINGSASFELPFTVETSLPIPGLALGSKIGVTVPDITKPKEIKLEFPNVAKEVRDRLNSLKKLDFAAVIQGVSAGLEYLKSLDVSGFALPLFNQEIPLLGINLRDSLDIAVKFNDFLLEFEQNPVGKLNEFADRIRDGIKAKTVRFSFDDGEIAGLSTKRPALRLDIAYATPAFEKELPLNLDLSSIEALQALGALVDVSASGNLKVKAGAEITLSLGFDVTDPTRPKPFLYTNDARKALGGETANTLQAVDHAAKVVTLKTGTDMSEFVPGDWIKLSGAKAGRIDSDQKPELFKISKIDIPNRRLTLVGDLDAGVTTASVWTLKRRGLVDSAGGDAKSTIESVTGKDVSFTAATDLKLFGDGGWLKLAGATGGVTDGGAKNLFKIVAVNAATRKVTLHAAPTGLAAGAKPVWTLKQEVGTGVNLTADADATGINFITSFGPLGIEIKNGSANLFPTGEAPNAPGGASFSLGLQESAEANPDGRRYLNEFAFSQGPVTVIEGDGRVKFDANCDCTDKFTVSLGTQLVTGESATVKLEINDPKEALFAIQPVGQLPTDADFKSADSIRFTPTASRFTVFVKGVDDAIKDGKRTSTLTLSIDKTAAGLPATLKNVKDKSVSVVTIDDEVLAKEQAPTVTRTGEFEVIVGASFGLKDLGIDTGNLKGTIQQALGGQVQAKLPIKLRGLPTKVSGFEKVANGPGPAISTTEPQLQFGFALSDLLNKGFKPRIDIVTPGGKVIVNSDGSTPFTKLITGGIEELKNGGVKNLVAMVGGWEGAFDHLIEAMNGEVFGITLPLVGDKLKEQAKFLEDMKGKVSAGLQAINDAEGYLKEKVQEVIYAGLGPQGINFLKDSHSEDGTLWTPDGKLTQQDVGIRILRDGGTLPTGVRFEMQLGKDIAFSTNPSFDIGVPGLDLKVDAPIKGNINIDFVLMVGVDGDVGFFIETGMADDKGNLIGAKDAQGNPLTKELTIGLDVSTPGLSAEGTLGFLKMGAKDLPGARIPVQNADGTQAFPLLVTGKKPDRSLEGVKFAFQTVANKDAVNAMYDATTRTITFIVAQSAGKIVTTAKELMDKANKSSSFNALFSMNKIGDADKPIVPTGATLLGTGKDKNTGKPRQPVVIVPKAPDANLADIRFVFKTDGITAANEGVVYDNVARTITFSIVAGKKAGDLVALANDATKSASFTGAFAAVLLDAPVTADAPALANEVIDTNTKQQNLGAVTRIAPSNFTAKFEVDLLDSPTDKDTKLTIPEAARLKRQAIDFTVSGAASLNFRLQSNLGDVALPGIRADLNLDWRFKFPKELVAAANAPASNAPKAQASNRKLPSLPDVIAINNVEINLGEFLNNFAGKTLKKVKEILDPVAPIIKLVSDPLPVISDLAGAPVSMLDIGRLFGGSVAAAVKFIDAVKRIKEIVDTIPTDLGADNWLRIGAFEIDTASLRGANALAASVGSRIPALKNINASNAEQIAKDMQQKVKDASAQAKSKNFNAGKFTKSAGSFKEGELNIAFPVLSNPSSLFNLMMGQDIDLVTLELPVFGLKAEMKRQFRGPGPLVFLMVEVGGSITGKIDVAFGYDTSGIRKFLSTKNVVDVFDGFFLTDHEKPDGSGPDIPEVQILGEITVSAGADIGIGSAKVGGGVYANIDFNLHDDNDDGKVRVNELVENAQLEAPVPGLHIFDVSGAVNARGYAEVSILGFTKKWETPSVTLAEFKLDRPGPIVPKLATKVGGDLILNIGPRAPQRIAGYRTQDVERNKVSGKDEAEKFKIQAGATADEIIVTALGQTQTFIGIKRIIGDAGEFNDEITIESSVTIPTDIKGGKGDDKLLGGSGVDTLDGGEGKDNLQGGDGDDVLRGGLGTDTIDGSGDDDTIEGGDEDDVLSGGSGKDTIRGGAGKDKIVGGFDDDVLFGDAGEDDIQGEGGQDTVDGGDDADVIQGGLGADTLRGGKGKDKIKGDSGNDKLFGDEDDDTLEGGFDEDTLDGGDGVDLLFGQQGIDTLRGGAGNDTLVGGPNSDFLFGDAGEDVLYVFEQDLTKTENFDNQGQGGDGNDRLYGSFGNDKFYGDSDSNPALTGNDVFYGYAGNDQMFGGPGSDDINGGDGKDILDGGLGDDNVQGDAGDDFLLGGLGKDSLTGGDGNDVLFGDLDGDAGDPLFFDRAAKDRINNQDVLRNYQLPPRFSDGDVKDFFPITYVPADLVTPKIVAGGFEGGTDDGDDKLLGGPGLDVLLAGSGADLLDGGDGADYLDAGAGNDVDVHGGAGDDVVRGGSGDDTIHGDDGIDQILGDDGADKLFGDSANSTIAGVQKNYMIFQRLFGGGGSDELFAFVPNDVANNATNTIAKFSNFVTNGEQMYGDSGNDVFYGGSATNDLIVGNAGNDVLFGDAMASGYVRIVGPTAATSGQADLLLGDDGEDQFFAGGGDDQIWGGADSDSIDGQGGKDVMYGGAGIDKFIIPLEAGVRENDETIRGHFGNRQLNDVTDDNATDIAVFRGTDNDDVIRITQTKDAIGQTPKLAIDITTGGATQSTTVIWSNAVGQPELEQFQVSALGGNDIVGFGLDKSQFGNLNLFDPLHLTATDLQTRAPVDLKALAERSRDWVTAFDGGGGNDLLVGTPGRDRFDGGLGSDVMFGFAGDDRLVGDSGSGSSIDVDTMFGGTGADDLLGGQGKNLLYAWSLPPSALLVPSQADGAQNFRNAQSFSKTSPSGGFGVFADAGGLLSTRSLIVDEATRTATFSVQLNRQPASSVTLKVTPSRIEEASVDKLNLTFDSTNWNQPQTVTVSGVEDRVADGDQSSNINVSVDVDQTNDHSFDTTAPQILSVVTIDSNATPVTNVPTNGEQVKITVGGDLALEDTGLNRQLGQNNDDFLFGGTSVDFLHGQLGNDLLFRRDGTKFESLDEGVAGASFAQYAKATNKVWYVSGSNANDEIHVDFVTEPGKLADHHIVTRLTENNGSFSFSVQSRLDFSALASTGSAVWDNTERLINIAGELGRRAEGRNLTDEELVKLLAAAKQNNEPLNNVLARDNDYLAIIIDALGGNDQVIVGPTVQKSVWVNGGEGDDRIINRSGKAILVDKTEQGKVNGLVGRNDQPEQAFHLGPIVGETTFAKLTIDSPTDVDWYKFALQDKPKEKSRLSVASLSTRDDQFTFEIYRPNDVKTPLATGKNFVSLTTLAANTEYLLKVTDVTRPTVYDLQFNLDGNDQTVGTVVNQAISIALAGSDLQSQRRDVMLGGAGDDVMMGGAGEDWIFGNEGSDVLSGGYDRGASDILFAGTGNDTFQIIPDDLPIIGSDPSSFFTGEAKTGQLTAADLMDGGAGQDRVLFLGGDKDRRGFDVPDIAALKYNTVLHRWEFASGVWDIGSQAFATTFVDANNNRKQDANEPTVYRQQHLHYQTRDVESTLLNGRSGDDVFHADPEFNVEKDGNKQDDTTLFAGNWGIAAGSLEQAAGSAARIRLLGGAGNDALYGGFYGDSLDGGDGNDYIVGDNGDDLITGGGGSDRLFGNSPSGLGADQKYDDFLPWIGARAELSGRPAELYSYELATPFVDNERTWTGTDVSQRLGAPVFSDFDWRLSTDTGRTLENVQPLPGEATFTEIPLDSSEPKLKDNENPLFVSGQPLQAEAGVRYFRRTFNVAAPQQTALRLQMSLTQNAVIFINGIEVARESANTGTPNTSPVFAGLTLRPDGSLTDVQRFDATTGGFPGLKTGLNEIIIATQNDAEGGFRLRLDLVPDLFNAVGLQGDEKTPSISSITPVGDFNGDKVHPKISSSTC